MSEKNMATISTGTNEVGDRDVFDMTDTNYNNQLIFFFQLIIFTSLNLPFPHKFQLSLRIGSWEEDF